jgi:spoIIIJ-associated protein
MADRVRGTGRSVTLEPMPPNERRIVHLALADDPAVMTVSIGEGEARKVAITPSR